MEVGKAAKQYLLTAESLASRSVTLNGHPLQLTAEHDLPAVEGADVGKGLLSVPAHSILFVAM